MQIHEFVGGGGRGGREILKILTSLLQSYVLWINPFKIFLKHCGLVSKYIIGMSTKCKK